MNPRTSSTIVFSSVLFLTGAGVAQTATDASAAKSAAAPILEALEKADADTLRFNEHIVLLSSPFMEGRVPGSRGMEIASEYMEFWYKRAGLQRPFTNSGGEASFRQAFQLSATPEVTGSSVSAAGAGLRAGTDFKPHTTGGGAATGPLVSIGYGITQGRYGYTNIPDGTSLAGKVALILRGNPIGEAEERWRASARYSVQRRVQDAAGKGAVGVILVSPSFDEGDELRVTSHRRVTIPVVSMTRKAVDSMLGILGAEAGVDALATANDKKGVVQDLGSKPVSLEVKVESRKLVAENVGGLLPGRGSLKNELIVVGAHLDHLGMGNFGSRSPNRGRVVHPGSDDNASGSAAVLMIAEKMAERYAKLPADKPARSVLFMGFSAEESGLHGSRFYADNMLEGYKCALMINFDMVGRVRNGNLQVMGTGSAKGMHEWVEPICKASPLDVRITPSAMGGSDHLNFLRKNIPVLMGHSGMHGDYHTERDVSEKINRVGGGQTAELFAQLGMAAATWDVTIEFQSASGGRRGR